MPESRTQVLPHVNRCVNHSTTRVDLFHRYVTFVSFLVPESFREICGIEQPCRQSSADCRSKFCALCDISTQLLAVLTTLCRGLWLSKRRRSYYNDGKYEGTLLALLSLQSIAIQFLLHFFCISLCFMLNSSSP